MKKTALKKILEMFIRFVETESTSPQGIVNLFGGLVIFVFALAVFCKRTFVEFALLFLGRTSQIDTGVYALVALAILAVYFLVCAGYIIRTNRPTVRPSSHGTNHVLHRENGPR